MDDLELVIEDAFRYASESLGPGAFDIIRFKLQDLLQEDPFIVAAKEPRTFYLALKKAFGPKAAETYLSILVDRLRASGVKVTKEDLVSALESNSPIRLAALLSSSRVSQVEQLYRRKLMFELDRISKIRKRRLMIGSVLLGGGICSMILLILSIIYPILTPIQVMILTILGIVLSVIVAVERYLSNTFPELNVKALVRLRLLGGSPPPGLSISARKVYRWIESHSNEGFVNLDISSTSLDLDMFPSDLIDSIMELEKAGLVRVERTT